MLTCNDRRGKGGGVYKWRKQKKATMKKNSQNLSKRNKRNSEKESLRIGKVRHYEKPTNRCGTQRCARLGSSVGRRKKNVHVTEKFKRGGGEGKLMDRKNFATSVPQSTQRETRGYFKNLKAKLNLSRSVGEKERERYFRQGGGVDVERRTTLHQDIKTQGSPTGGEFCTKRER